MTVARRRRDADVAHRPVATSVNAGASERVLTAMSALADSDITLLLGCRTTGLAAAVDRAVRALAAGDPYRQVGARARALESAFRRGEGCIEGERVGPVDVSRTACSVLVRWSHLAGDAWSLQEFVLAALARAGLLSSAPACRCVQSWPAGPRALTPADVWRVLVHQGGAPSSALRAAWPAIVPFVRPLSAALPRLPGSGGGRDAIAVLTVWDAGGRTGDASRFSRVASILLSLLERDRGGARRLGVTFDLRRHESLGSWSGVGNLSCVGYVNVGPASDAAAVHAKLQRLIRTRFWRQQIALDFWLAGAAGRTKDALATTLVERVARVAPVTVTELWRGDGASCAQCGLPRRVLPDGMNVLAIPPALPPAGLTVGLTRSPAGLRVVMRRLTTPTESADAWLRAVLERGAGRLDEAGVEVTAVQRLGESPQICA